MRTPLQPGTLVRLRYCPCGEPGVVTGDKRGHILVYWRDLGMTGKHPPESLVLAGNRAKGGGTDYLGQELRFLLLLASSQPSPRGMPLSVMRNQPMRISP